MQENLLKEAGDYTKTRYGIITLSIKQLMNTHKDFADLLLLMSLLDSQNIPIDLLNNYKNDIVVENFVLHLKKYSLVSSESSIPSFGSILSVHRTTQAITLAYLIQTLNLEKNKQLIKPIATALEQYLDNSLANEDLNKMKLLVNHCNVLLMHSRFLDDNTNCAVYGALGYIHSCLGDYEKAEKFLKISFLTSNTDKVSTNRTACNLGYLSNIYSEIGRQKEAGNLLEKSIKLYEKYFSENYNKIIRASSNLGYVYKELGDYKKAAALLEQNLNSYRDHFPDDYLGMVWTLLYMGYLYQETGEYTKSLVHLEHSFSICKQYLAENHMVTVWVLTHLGNIYLQLDNVEKTKKLTEQALDVCKANFSDNHTSFYDALTRSDPPIKILLLRKIQKN